MALIFDTDSEAAGLYLPHTRLNKDGRRAKPRGDDPQGENRLVVAEERCRAVDSLRKTAVNYARARSVFAPRTPPLAYEGESQ